MMECLTVWCGVKPTNEMVILSLCLNNWNFVLTGESLHMPHKPIGFPGGACHHLRYTLATKNDIYEEQRCLSRCEYSTRLTGPAISLFSRIPKTFTYDQQVFQCVIVITC